MTSPLLALAVIGSVTMGGGDFLSIKVVCCCCCLQAWWFNCSAGCTTVDAALDDEPAKLLFWFAMECLWTLKSSVCCDLSSLASPASSSKLLPSTPSSRHFSHDVDDITSGRVWNFSKRCFCKCPTRFNGGDQLPEYFVCWNSRLHIRRNSACFLIEMFSQKKPPPPPLLVQFPPPAVVGVGDIASVDWGESGMKYFTGLETRVVDCDCVCCCCCCCWGWRKNFEFDVYCCLLKLQLLWAGELWPFRDFIASSPQQLEGLPSAVEFLVLSSYAFCCASEYLKERKRNSLEVLKVM